MPYKNDPRRTLTLNLLPDEYDAVAAQAAAAGYATPGPYAKAQVLGQRAAKLATSEARASKWAARAKQAERALAAATLDLAAAEQARAQAEQALAQAPVFTDQHRQLLNLIMR